MFSMSQSSSYINIVTDDLAFGEDFGDYLYGFTYDKEEHSFEHAGSSDYDFSIEFC